MDMMEQVIDPAKIYMKVVKIILSSSTENIFRMRFVLFEDLPSPTEKNFKKLLLQQVGSKVSTHCQPIFSTQFSTHFLAIGFLIMGFIGYFVKLIHIPINNIIVG